MIPVSYRIGGMISQEARVAGARQLTFHSFGRAIV